MIGVSEFDIDKAQRNNAIEVVNARILLKFGFDHNLVASGTPLPAI